MKRWISSLLTGAILFSLVACAGNAGQREEMGGVSEPLYRNNTDTRIGYVRNDIINGEESAEGGGQNEIGYFRYNPANYRTANGRAPGPDVFIDRSLLAQHIAQLVTVLPNVKEATALVTDDHIFVGVSAKNGKLDGKTMKEVKRTAESVTPRYYKVHVTSDRTLESQINEIGMRMRGDYDVEGLKGDLEYLLRQMGDNTPPGLNESINPTGRDQINPQQD